VVSATGAANRGVVQRSDLTGFNWADVPAVLIETGFLSNAAEASRLHTPAYQQRVALGIARGVVAFAAP
jgi:N-acetylmuramoyl-L-alanine amidase